MRRRPASIFAGIVAPAAETVVYAADFVIPGTDRLETVTYTVKNNVESKHPFITSYVILHINELYDVGSNAWVQAYELSDGEWEGDVGVKYYAHGAGSWQDGQGRKLHGGRRWAVD